MLTLALALCIGIIIGAVLGLTGAGGSVFAVPLFLLVLNLPVNEAIGLSLAVVTCSALFGVITRLKSGLIAWAPALIFAITGMLTAPFGKWLGSLTAEGLLLGGFNLLALIIAFRMWQQARQHPEQSEVVRARPGTTSTEEAVLCRFNPQGRFELKPRCMTGLAVGGLITGTLSGLFGVGGGFLVVPMLNMLTGMTMHRAVATSLLIITLISGSGFLTSLWLQASFSWTLFGLLCGGGVLGMLLGNVLSRRLANAHLQSVFAVALIVVSLVSLGNFLFAPGNG